MQLRTSFSELWRKLFRRHPQNPALTLEDYCSLDSIKARPGDASEFVLLDECFGIGRDVPSEPARVRKTA